MDYSKEPKFNESVTTEKADKTVENESANNSKDFVGIKHLKEIYELVAEKAIAGLKTETVPSENTYKMITLSQDLYSQMNAQAFNYPRFSYWGSPFGTGGCI